MSQVDAGRRPGRWTEPEFLEQVLASDGGDALAETAKAILHWAQGHHPFLRILGGRGWSDRSLIMYAGSGHGRGVLTLYAAENGGGPMLEVQIDYMSSMSPQGYHRAREYLVSRLRELDIPRLQADDVLGMSRPNIPLSQLASGRLEPLLSMIDEWIAAAR